VPVLSILDLGIVRDVQEDDKHIKVIITPTYSGCPAMHMIASMIRIELLAHGYVDIQIEEQLSPAWTTDWMTESGKKKLQEYGIAPPQYATKNNPLRTEDVVVPCPRCHSQHTELISQFGSTSCKALYRCLDCKEPFDYFKCH
jgi:ring-1,2-phenylacetyl-CoA epoxidase subunit PaaD